MTKQMRLSIMTGLAGAVSLLAGSGGATAQVTPTADSAITPLRFSPSVPPPGFTPTFLQWNANALQSLAQGGGPVGDPATDAAAYVPQATVRRGDFFSTFSNAGATFPSFKGVANPPAPYDQQYGSALIFPLRLVSTAEKFRLSNLDNVTTSNDPGNYLDEASHLAAGRDYGATRVGIDYGPDGVRGGGDDITYNGGQAGSTLVNELLYSGVADFQEVTDFGPNDQNDIDQSIGAFYAAHPLTRISNTYFLRDDAGRLLAEVTKTVTIVPEPASAGLLAAGGLMLLRRRRRA